MARLWLLMFGVMAVLHPATCAADADHVVRVLQGNGCPNCQLSDADLVHADLRDINLSHTKLQRANLGQARLDGADLSHADLSFTSLNGASLRGADLRGSRLYGTDLRGADLSGAKMDPGALEQSHWQGAKGIVDGARGHAGLHNAGVDAALAGRWPAAETLFSAAIQTDPEQPLSWVARGLSRGERARLILRRATWPMRGDCSTSRAMPSKLSNCCRPAKRCTPNPIKLAAKVETVWVRCC